MDGVDTAYKLVVEAAAESVAVTAVAPVAAETWQGSVPLIAACGVGWCLGMKLTSPDVLYSSQQCIPDTWGVKVRGRTCSICRGIGRITSNKGVEEQHT